MNIIDALKARHRYRLKKKNLEAINRKQFNMTINARMVDGIKYLASKFGVPRYAITEHLIQVGTYHVVRASEDLDKDNLLKAHLINSHLLGDGGSEAEELMRLGCIESYAKELIPIIAKAYRCMTRLKKALDEVSEGGRTAIQDERIDRLQRNSDAIMMELLKQIKIMEVRMS